MRTMCTFFLRTLVYPNMRLRSKVNCFPYCFPFADSCLTSTIEHNLSGEVLCMIGPEDLKEIGIATVGQRLAILKAIYLIKLAHEIPFEPDHYIPPC